MNPAEWFDFMAEKEEYVTDQIKTHLPGLDFSAIKVGLPPIVYLQQERGMAEVTINAVKLDLDDGGDVTRVEILMPA